MSTLITHHQPHLDDLCGMWLFNQYMPGFEEADIAFVPTSITPDEAVNSDDTLYVGVGRGEFDEHKGDHGECATSLVYNYLKLNDRIPEEEEEVIERIVEWVRAEDTGMLMTEPHREYSIPSILLGEYYVSGKDSASVALLCAQMLDGIFASVSNEVLLEEAWVNREDIITPYGPCALLITKAHEIAPFVYAKGFPLCATIDPEGTYHNIRGQAGTDIDLTPTFEKLKEVDPDADWFFHHSKKMLICGGEKQPDATTSSLTMEQLKEVLQSS